jgi:hypothetical protein
MTVASRVESYAAIRRDCPRSAAPVSCSPVPPELRHEHILQRTDFERIGHGVDRSGTVAQARRSRARGKSVVVGVAILVAGLVAGCGE